ncbi:hypothetical protein ACFQU1_20420 [Chelatococcus sp. GCM10030263]|uniref:hypothetical protein n=1 Tax=Chelatococcus sp. GCM10030263 TaxID=3273387 RepID=UPI00361E20DD
MIAGTLVALQIAFAGLLLTGIYMLCGLPWVLIAGAFLCLCAYMNLYLRMMSGG